MARRRRSAQTRHATLALCHTERAYKQAGGGGVEPFEVARVEHDPGRGRNHPIRSSGGACCSAWVLRRKAGRTPLFTFAAQPENSPPNRGATTRVMPTAPSNARPANFARELIFGTTNEHLSPGFSGLRLHRGLCIEQSCEKPRDRDLAGDQRHRQTGKCRHNAESCELTASRRPL
jgi:hypothetical protein